MYTGLYRLVFYHSHLPELLDTRDAVSSWFGLVLCIQFQVASWLYIYIVVLPNWVHYSARASRDEVASCTAAGGFVSAAGGGYAILQCTVVSNRLVHWLWEWNCELQLHWSH